MNKHLIFFMLISIGWFAQKIVPLQFSIAEIDRLSENKSCLLFSIWAQD